MAGFDISADLYRSLRANVATVFNSVKEAEVIIQNHLFDVVQQQAKADPRWIGVADSIHTWDENDRFWIGVDDPEFVSEAFAAEYGTDEYPPSPIFRTLGAETRNAAAKASMHLSGRLGTRYE